MSYNQAIALDLVHEEASPSDICLGVNDIALVVETDLKAMEREWREFEQFAAGHVFQTFDWVSTWHSTVGAAEGVTPQIVVGWAPDGRLLFLLPLGLTRSRGVTALTWLGGRLADVKCGLYEPDFLAGLTDIAWAGLWRRVRSLLPSVDLVHLSDQPETIGQARNPFLPWRTHAQPDRTHNTRIGTDWETYYKSKRGKSDRKGDARRSKKIDAMGEVAFEVIQDSAAAHAILLKLFAEKARNLARMGVADPFADENVRQFYFRHAERLCPHGQTHLSVLRLNGEPISIDWGFVHRGRYYYLLSSYDPSYYAVSPGTRHLQELMQWCMANGIGDFDFGVGDQSYKMEWCEEHVTLFATIEAVSWIGRAAVFALGVKAQLKHRIKTSKTLWPMAQRLRARIRGSQAQPAAES